MHAVDTTILDFIGGRNKVCVIPPFQRNKDKTLVVGPYLIEGTEYYSEGTVSSMSARVYSKQLLDLYGFTDDVKLFVNKKEED